MSTINTNTSPKSAPKIVPRQAATPTATSLTSASARSSTTAQLSSTMQSTFASSAATSVILTVSSASRTSTMPLVTAGSVPVSSETLILALGTTTKLSPSMAAAAAAAETTSTSVGIILAAVGVAAVIGLAALVWIKRKRTDEEEPPKPPRNPSGRGLGRSRSLLGFVSQAAAVNDLGEMATGKRATGPPSFIIGRRRSGSRSSGPQPPLPKPPSNRMESNQGRSSGLQNDTYNRSGSYRPVGPPLRSREETSKLNPEAYSQRPSVRPNMAQYPSPRRNSSSTNNGSSLAPPPPPPKDIHLSSDSSAAPSRSKSLVRPAPSTNPYRSSTAPTGKAPQDPSYQRAGQARAPERGRDSEITYQESRRPTHQRSSSAGASLRSDPYRQEQYPSQRTANASPSRRSTYDYKSSSVSTNRPPSQGPRPYYSRSGSGTSAHPYPRESSSAQPPPRPQSSEKLRTSPPPSGFDVRGPPADPGPLRTRPSQPSSRGRSSMGDQRLSSTQDQQLR
ncbi:hypothetical protein HDU93_002547 [Gonapodya sp. JEL0774]|nr:hypothetical protein HDU93_002547 [Gonapodya sp. JEL0774]